MSDKRRKPSWHWIVVLVVVLLAYPLSFGPACWISSRLDFSVPSVTAFYRPLVQLCNRNEVSRDAAQRYATIGSPPLWAWNTVSLPSRQLELRWHKMSIPRGTTGVVTSTRSPRRR